MFLIGLTNNLIFSSTLLKLLGIFKLFMTVIKTQTKKKESVNDSNDSKEYKMKTFILDQCSHYWFQAPGKLPVPVVVARESFGSFESLLFIFKRKVDFIVRRLWILISDVLSVVSFNPDSRNLTSSFSTVQVTDY